MIATASPSSESNVAAVPGSTFICPHCGGELERGGKSLSCTHCHSRYEISATAVPAFARQGASSRFELPVLYDAAQLALGSRRSLSRVKVLLDRVAPTSVLDVGGGTGLYAAAVPESARYVVVDADAAKLARLRTRVPRAEAVLADATRLPIRTKSFDLALFIAVAHHLSDEALERALAELVRVTRELVLVVEPLASERRAPRMLWRLDRGSFPRRAEELTARLARRFEPEHLERYSIHHDYLLWLGRPRAAAAA